MGTSLQTKTLIKTFWVSDLYSNRETNVYISNQYYMTGTKTATGVMGCLYKYYDTVSKSYKYLLTAGIARQNKNWVKPIALPNMMEAAKYNEQVNPVINIVYDKIDEYVSYESALDNIQNAFYKIANGIISSYPPTFIADTDIPWNMFRASTTYDTW